MGRAQKLGVLALKLALIGCSSDGAGSKGVLDGPGTGNGDGTSDDTDTDTDSVTGGGDNDGDEGVTDDAGGGHGNRAESHAPPLGVACAGRSKPGVDGTLPTFKTQEVSQLPGSAYLFPADLDGDDYPEFLLTTLSEGVDLRQVLNGIPLADGGAYVLRRNANAAKGELGEWSETKVFDKAAGIGWPNSSELFDLDGDQVVDWVIGAGFLTKPTGRIVWIKGDGTGGFGTPQDIAVPDAQCWYHIALGLDMDADGDNDFVTSCHVGDTKDLYGPSRVEWFENKGDGGFTSHVIGDGGGSLLSLYDLDQDGDQDVVAPQFFGPEALVWYEQTGAKGTKWKEHVINDTTGRGFAVKFADINGDGETDLVYGNHNNQQADDEKNQTMGVYWFEIPGANQIRELANWDDHMHVVYEGFMVPPATGPLARSNKDSAGAPGMINVGDIDGDCDIDITASGDGDEGLYAFIQQKKGFDKLELSKDRSHVNSGEQHVVDLDLDGDFDIIWAVFGPQGARFSSRVYAFLQD